MIYLEYDDRHNEPVIRSYENEDDALDHITRFSSSNRKEVYEALLYHDESNEEFTGEWHSGSDKWTLITAEIADDRALYWSTVAKAIRGNQKVPL